MFDLDFIGKAQLLAFGGWLHFAMAISEFYACTVPNRRSTAVVVLETLHNTQQQNLGYYP
jgi:hypothetical protein